MRNILLLLFAMALAGPALPAHAGSLPQLLVSERLYAWEGHWHAADWKQVPNSEPLRIAVQIDTPYGPATGVSVHVSLRHLSWQIFHRVVQPADVEGALRQTMQHGHLARFQTILRVPATHPLQFSQVVITIASGGFERTVTSGVTFEPPPTPSQAKLHLTVPQAFSFCAARSRLRYLSYGVAMRAYVRGINAGGDGPPQWLFLASPQTNTTNIATLERRHEGFRGGGFGIRRPATGGLTTVTGSLFCHPSLGFSLWP